MKQHELVRLGIGVENTGDTADDVFLLAKRDTRLIGNVLLIDIGLAVIRNSGMSMHRRRRILCLVVEFHAIAKIIANIKDACIGILLPAWHGRG